MPRSPIKISVQTRLLIARSLLAIFLLLTAMPRFSAADASYFTQQLMEVGLPALPWLAPILGVVQLLVVVALIVPQQRWAQVLLYLYASLATVPLLMMFTHPVWLDSLGGFPAIGAGQGLIKYLGIVGLALFISSFYSGNKTINRLAEKLMLAGIVLVMLWIGGMKFTQYEADGIEGLMRTSPLFSWIYDVFSVLHGSYFIGVIELIAVAGIALLPWSKNAYIAGLSIAALTFAATQTFVISLPAYETSMGFAMLTGSGQFIVKDLALLACSIILLAKALEGSTSEDC
ncbi:hypothetical protein TUM4438_25480 [Shewanella sairae]|uniref:DUF417 family protein n=1 Tax=Shewanella sairae TaxID=190310 RepID=A0ABQ4PI58_9GAMM|nr:DUF417 family protein [Shewanella sairae]MCL1131565.1 DUF417 family protein [Shewanella sairae]GIU47179.1 hypothetical protein TUM4438_25480 [Shewanella sairae]